jgi:hypothetical protein
MGIILLFFISVLSFLQLSTSLTSLRVLWQIKEWSASTAMLTNYFIAILEGEARRLELRPHLEASKQTQLKLSYFFPIFHSIFNGVVVITLATCADSPGSSLCKIKNIIHLLLLFNHLFI